jgi:ATP-binding cassette subfamily C (CFTR/MRP) protein 1
MLINILIAWWVKKWAAFNQDHPNQQLGLYLGVYGFLGALALVFLIISCWQVHTPLLLTTAR